MTGKRPHYVNRGDGVHINLNAPLRARKKQMGISLKKLNKPKKGGF